MVAALRVSGAHRPCSGSPGDDAAARAGRVLPEPHVITTGVADTMPGRSRTTLPGGPCYLYLNVTRAFEYFAGKVSTG
jgi:hypothetical protein